MITEKDRMQEDIARYIYNKVKILDEGIEVRYDAENCSWVLYDDECKGFDNEYLKYCEHLSFSLGICIELYHDKEGTILMWNKEKEYEFLQSLDEEQREYAMFLKQHGELMSKVYEEYWEYLTKNVIDKIAIIKRKF